MTPITAALTPQFNDIWQNCYNFGHEMIITTKIRRIFPTMEFQINGLEQNKSYKLSMHFELLDDLKYRFDSSTKGFTSSISHGPKDPAKIVFHPRGTRTGSEWMSNTISFDNIRITCTKKLETESENYVHLLTGHRYQPVLIVYESDKLVQTSRIKHTIFLVSTIYHNESIRTYKRTINKFSTKSEAEQKVGIVGRKRNSTAATWELSAKQSRSQDDDEPSISGSGFSGEGVPGAIPLKFGAAPSFHLSLGASFDSGSHLVVRPTPPISPPEDPVEQKTLDELKFIKCEALPGAVTPSITPESISISRPSTPEVQIILEVAPGAPKCPIPIRTSPESVEPRSIKSVVDALSAATVALPGAENSSISPKSIGVDVSESRPKTPEVQVIQEAAPDAPDRPGALRPSTPETIQAPGTPGATHRPVRPVEVVPIWQLFQGLPMMPMMPMVPFGMMPFGMMPYPIYFNPMMLQAQPPVIPEPAEEENNEAEVEFIDIIN